MKIFLFVWLLIFAGVSIANDELSKKYDAIDRYQKAQSPQKMMETYVEEYSKQLSPTQAQLFKEILLEELDIVGLQSDVRTLMAKHFTLPELIALADFFESPQGASAMSKMGLYMAEFQPVFNAELSRLLGIWEAKAAGQSATETPYYYTFADMVSDYKTFDGEKALAYAMDETKWSSGYGSGYDSYRPT